jgi:acylphosphatase
MKTRAHVFVSGRVQGVFYRAYTREKAKELGVFGWVRNLPDGRVEAVLEGEKDDIDKLILNLKKGPPSARVENIDLTLEDYRTEFRNFYVEYHSD